MSHNARATQSVSAVFAGDGGGSSWSAWTSSRQQQLVADDETVHNHCHR